MYNDRDQGDIWLDEERRNYSPLIRGSAVPLVASLSAEGIVIAFALNKQLQANEQFEY